MSNEYIAHAGNTVFDDCIVMGFGFCVALLIFVIIAFIIEFIIGVYKD